MRNALPIILFLLTVISRLPFTSKYLYHMDSGHFTLALDKYDLVLHQPHPPGYFLYVMLGRLLHLFISDANAAFVVISIFFSGLTVVAVYYLCREMFDERIGIIAALLAVTSPNLWFHGEVALTYSVEAFFSALVGLVCWRMIGGKKEYIWLSVAILALAGGFRQNSVVFLLPLWVFSVKKQNIQRILTALALALVLVASWFVPMVKMTGGLDAYIMAFKELWQFNTGHNSVFERGFPIFKHYSLTVNGFLFFTVGMVLPALILSSYTIVRKRKYDLLNPEKTGFFVWWALPSLMFYLLIFIHPANPGYFLILLPPLVCIGSVSLIFLAEELHRLTGQIFTKSILFIALLGNICLFMFSPLPTSRSEIVAHDKNVAEIIYCILRFNPKDCALFIQPYSFYSYRHLMHYVPEFTVYQVDVRIDESGGTRKQFGGVNRSTFITEKISPPKGITSFAAIILDDPRNPPKINPRFSVARMSSGMWVVSGPIEMVCELYPELRSIWFHSGSAANLNAPACKKQKGVSIREIHCGGRL